MIAVSGTLTLRTHPGARQDALRDRMADGTYRVDVTAPPEGGRANEAVCVLLAELLGVRTSDVRVIRGRTSRRKVIEVDRLESDEIERRLEAALTRERS